MNKENLLYLVLIWIFATVAYVAAVLFYFDFLWTAVSTDFYIFSAVLLVNSFALSFSIPYMDKGVKGNVERILTHLLGGTLIVIFFGFFSKWLSVDLLNIISTDFSGSLSIAKISVLYIVYALTLLKHYSFSYRKNLIAKEKAESELRSLLKESELNLLRSQLNPHFIFNSLNSISSLILTRPEKAHEMIVLLSDFLRFSLSKGKEKESISLREELDQLDRFIAIEKCRFGNRLNWKVNVDENLLNIKVPALILQPLIENALKYGVYDHVENGYVELSIARNENSVEIKVKNPIDTQFPEKKGAGIGHQIVRRRIKYFYDEQAELIIKSSEGTFESILLIPF